MLNSQSVGLINVLITDVLFVEIRNISSCVVYREVLRTSSHRPVTKLRLNANRLNLNCWTGAALMVCRRRRAIAQCVYASVVFYDAMPADVRNDRIHTETDDVQLRTLQRQLRLILC